MSHFTVATIIPASRLAPPDETGPLDHNDVSVLVDEALAPFDEQLEVDPYSEPLDSFHLSMLIKLAHDKQLLILPDGLGEPPAELQALTEWVTSLIERAGVGSIAEACAAVSHESEIHLDENGRIAHRTRVNPQGRWDWHTIGGRWAGKFDPDRKRDVLRIGEIDWADLERGARLDAGLEWDRLSNDAPERLGNLSRDEYVEAVAPTYLPTAALLTEDDGWREPARIGLFGSSYHETMSEAEWARYWIDKVRSQDPDAVLVLVDCHT